MSRGARDDRAARPRDVGFDAYLVPSDERDYEVGRVIDAVSRVYHGNRNAINAFLSRPHPLLEGETPFDMARSGSAGAEAVLNLIRRAEAGIAL